MSELFMTTQKQIETNQQNALLSTGATTDEGKAIVAKNAIKHGIFTKDFIVVHKRYEEKVADYQELLDNLITAFDPQGQMELLLIEKIAMDYWRMRRVLRFEVEGIYNMLNVPIDLIHPLPNIPDADKVIRYERHLQKSIMQNIVMLKQIQLSK